MLSASRTCTGNLFETAPAACWKLSVKTFKWLPVGRYNLELLTNLVCLWLISVTYLGVPIWRKVLSPHHWYKLCTHFTALCHLITTYTYICESQQGSHAKSLIPVTYFFFFIYWTSGALLFIEYYVCLITCNNPWACWMHS